jgi:hypothetical protein
VAASHFAVVVLFQPHVYGDRLLMPLYMLLVPYAAIPIIAISRVAARIGRERAALACWALMCVVLMARALGAFTGVDMDILVIALLLGGLCFAGVRELRPLRVTIYVAYALVLAIWLVREPGEPRAAYCRLEWLFLAVALFSEALLISLGTPDARSRIAGGWRVLAYAAGAVLTIVVLRAVGTAINPERALLAGRIAAFGIAGATVYALVWFEGAWPAGPSTPALAAQGVVLGFFVAILSGTDLADAGDAPLLLAGLGAGAASLSRLAARALLDPGPA